MRETAQNDFLIGNSFLKGLPESQIFIKPETK